jgi:hypothetical protein
MFHYISFGELKIAMPQLYTCSARVSPSYNPNGYITAAKPNVRNMTCVTIGDQVNRMRKKKLGGSENVFSGVPIRLQIALLVCNFHAK